MDCCIAITRSGFGTAYRFENRREAVLHPIIQYGDSVLDDAGSLFDEYGLSELPKLLELLGNEELRQSVLGRISELEKAGRSPRLIAEELCRGEIHASVWRALVLRSVEPPEDSSVVLQLVRSDREWDINHRKGSSMAAKEKAPATEKKPAEPKKIAGLDPSTRVTFGSRKVGDKDVEYAASGENNPKRGKAAERFGNYKKNMTLEQAVAAGVTPADVAWDLNKGFIKVVAK